MTKTTDVKKCSGCKIIKKVEEFYRCVKRADGLVVWCKECCKKYNNEHRTESNNLSRKYYHQDLEKQYKKSKKYRDSHKKEIKIKRQKYNLKNKEKNKIRGQLYYLKNKLKIRERQRLYNINHNDRTKRQRKQFNINNPDYFKNMYHQNSIYKIKLLLSHRINNAIKLGYKTKHTMELVGCSIEFLMQHLQSTAIKNGYLDFDINNYSGIEYHIDHMIPCDAFHDLSKEEQQKVCFHWSNLQILKSDVNISKNAKIIYDIPESMQKFIKPELLTEGNTNGLFKENNGR